MSTQDLPARRRELLYAAIVDAEGTIRATDTKASIALVLHGLLLSATVTVAKDAAGSPSQGADTLAVIFAAVLLGGATLCFLGSVLALVVCVVPAPARIFPDTTGYSRGVFFPKAQNTFAGARRFRTVSEMVQVVENMDEQEIEHELVSEVLSVSAVRDRKLRLVARGLWLLAGEVVITTAFLALLAAFSL